jgi:hypothetical protein
MKMLVSLEIKWMDKYNGVVIKEKSIGLFGIN